MLNVNKYPEFRSIRLDLIIPDLKQLIEFQLEYGINKKKKVQISCELLIKIHLWNHPPRDESHPRQKKLRIAESTNLDPIVCHRLSRFIQLPV